MAGHQAPHRHHRRGQHRRQPRPPPHRAGARGRGGQLRGPETLAGLAAETGAKAVTVAEAARGRDVVIVTIPQKNIPDLPAGLFDGVPETWSSWTPATTIRGSATAASTGSRRD